MKRIIISTLTLLMISVLATFIRAGNSLAGEVVLCVNQEEQSAVLVDAKGLCGKGENEYSISGVEIKRSEDLVPLVVFSDNENCDEGSTGTITQVGFDKNDDGVLEADEVMANSGSCVTLGQEELAGSSEE